MYPRLFGHPYLNTFGICVVVGIVLCFAVGRYYSRAKGAWRPWAEFAELNAYVAIAMGLLVSFLAQALFFYLGNPSTGFRLSGAATYVSGFMGGLGSYLALYLAFGRRRFGPRLVEVAPVAPLCITIAHAFGRLGCFFAGCCYGKSTDSPFGVAFPALGRRVHPTQLYESVFLFFLFGVLSYLTFRRQFSQGFAVYLIAYGVFRFFVEFLRGDDRGALLGSLPPSQTLALVMAFGGIVAWIAVGRLLDRYRADTTLPRKIEI